MSGDINALSATIRYIPSHDCNARRPAFGRGRLVALVGIWLGISGAAADARQTPNRPIVQKEKAAMTDDTTIAGLPHAGGRTFTSLDAYLTYLRENGAPIDKPWYREVSPGVYVLQRGNMRRLDPPPTFTRDELARKFGFSR